MIETGSCLSQFAVAATHPLSSPERWTPPLREKGNVKTAMFFMVMKRWLRSPTCKVSGSLSLGRRKNGQVWNKVDWENGGVHGSGEWRRHPRSMPIHNPQRKLKVKWWSSCFSICSQNAVQTNEGLPSNWKMFLQTHHKWDGFAQMWKTFYQISGPVHMLQSQMNNPSRHKVWDQKWPSKVISKTTKP